MEPKQSKEEGQSHSKDSKPSEPNPKPPENQSQSQADKKPSEPTASDNQSKSTLEGGTADTNNNESTTDGQGDPDEGDEDEDEKSKKSCCGKMCRKTKKVYPELPKYPKSLTNLKDARSFLVKLCDEPVATTKCCHYELGWKYEVYKNQRTDKLLYTAEEDHTKTCSAYCKNSCLKTDRSFKFALKGPENDGEPILTITRPCSCKCCFGSQACGDMCGHSVKVELTDGTLVGTVAQKCNWTNPVYIIKNEAGNPRFKVTTPRNCEFCCCCRMCCGETIFSIIAKKKSIIWKRKAVIGSIELKDDDDGNMSRGRARARENGPCPNRSSFKVEFPQQLDVRLKATLLGAAILVDFLHFEKDPCGITQFCC